jgi:hypothetical protein
MTMESQTRSSTGPDPFDTDTKIRAETATAVGHGPSNLGPTINPQSIRRGRPITSGEDQVDLPVSPQKAEEARDLCVTLARRASDAFKDACNAPTADEAESAFATVKQMLEELWGYAYLRDRPFRDLLALLDAALKRASLVDLKENERDVLRQAFRDLPKWMLDICTVDEHIIRFADQGVDITSPLRPINGKQIRMKIEVIKE